VDSNFQYAEAVKLGCRRFFLRRLLGTGRGVQRFSSFFIDIDRLIPSL
jgi:hypothetical protein